MGFRPPKTIENGKTLRDIIDAAITPRPASQQTQNSQQSPTARTESPYGLNRIVGATRIELTAWNGAFRRKMTLIPTNHAYNRIAGNAHRQSRASFDATISNPVAICSSNDWKEALAADGFARNTTSMPSGKACSYREAKTRKRRLTELRVTALPTALDTASPIRRAPGVTTPCALASSRIA